MQLCSEFLNHFTLSVVVATLANLRANYHVLLLIIVANTSKLVLVSVVIMGLIFLAPSIPTYNASHSYHAVIPISP